MRTGGKLSRLRDEVLWRWHGRQYMNVDLVSTSEGRVAGPKKVRSVKGRNIDPITFGQVPPGTYSYFVSLSADGERSPWTEP